MSRNFLEILRADRAARTAQQQHGSGVLTLVDDKPVHASGCHLPNGEVVDAVCLAHRDGETVWSRPIDATRLRRRGRLVIEPGKALYFVDESRADIPQDACVVTADLARDLACSARIQACARSELFAGLLYAALCATQWQRRDGNESWGCSWRSAGDIVAGLRGDGDYLSWYCWGHETMIDEAVLTELDALGWVPVNLEATS